MYIFLLTMWKYKQIGPVYLDKMVTLGYITKQQADAIQATPQQG